jgi:hypothetical protein
MTIANERAIAKSIPVIRQTVKQMSEVEISAQPSVIQLANILFRSP